MLLILMTKNAKIFKALFCTLAYNLYANLLPSSFKFSLPSVRQYYVKILKLPNSKFKSNFVFDETISKILKNMDENKTVGMDNLSGKFLKDRATVLAKPISQFSILIYEVFNISVRLQNSEIKTTL